MTNVAIPKSVQTISAGAFGFCSALTKVELAEGVRELHYNAFLECTKLREVTIPKSVRLFSFDVFEDEHVTLRVYKGSYAEYWARDERLSYVVIDEQGANDKT